MAFTLPDLPYAHDALGPHMSKETLEFHHDKHHLAYVNTGNGLIKDTKFADMALEGICKTAFSEGNQALVNQAGQHYNHMHFWNWMKPNGGGTALPGKVEGLVAAYGGYDKMRADFIQAGTTQFGSGWAWLAIKDGKLEVTKTANGENPLMHGSQPVLGCDVWEHSYYIDFRNARPAYLESFIDNLVNWEYVEGMIDAAA